MLTTSGGVVNCSGFCLPPFSNLNFYEKKFLASKIAVVRLVFLLVICSCWYKALLLKLGYFNELEHCILLLTLKQTNKFKNIYLSTTCGHSVLYDPE